MATYVVDQNQLRKPELQARIQNEPDARLVIPDVALVEMSKNDVHWKDTMRNSLAPLLPAVERTEVSLSLGEAMTAELKNRRAIDKEALLPADFASFVRALVIEFDNSNTGLTLTDIEAKFEEIHAQFLSQELDAQTRKSDIERIVKAWTGGLKNDVLKAMRNEKYGPNFRLAFIQTYVQTSLFPAEMKKLGFSDNEVTTFKAAQPMVLRYMYLLVRHALDWAISGGLPNVAPAKELNHLLDMEYAAIASYYDGLLSEDNGAIAAYNDLKQMLQTAEDDAYEEYKAVLIQIFPNLVTERSSSGTIPSTDTFGVRPESEGYADFGAADADIADTSGNVPNDRASSIEREPSQS